jgi:hypothetical protein
MKNKKAVIGVIALLVVVLLLLGAYFIWKPKGKEGEKTISVEVIANDETVSEYTIKTQEKFLRKALEEKDLIQGKEDQYGLFIQTVDGITANDANQEWWCITKGGEQVTTGVDATPIEDGDSFELTLKVGY